MKSLNALKFFAFFAALLFYLCLGGWLFIGISMGATFTDYANPQSCEYAVLPLEFVTTAQSLGVFWFILTAWCLGMMTLASRSNAATLSFGSISLAGLLLWGMALLPVILRRSTLKPLCLKYWKGDHFSDGVADVVIPANTVFQTLMDQCGQFAGQVLLTLFFILPVMSVAYLFWGPWQRAYNDYKKSTSN